MVESLDGIFNQYGTALKLRSLRQEILTSNIANADTPGFRAKDFNFASALNTALHQTNGTPVSQSVQMQYRVPSQNSLDGNTVDMDVERAQFADNALHYEANLTLLSAHIKDLIAATTS